MGANTVRPFNADIELITLHDELAVLESKLLNADLAGVPVLNRQIRQIKREILKYSANE